MKLSSRKQLLSEADAELRQIKDLVIEGRRIQETFKKKMSVDEFSPMGKINTSLDVYIGDITTFSVYKQIPRTYSNMIPERIKKEMSKFAEKYQGKYMSEDYDRPEIQWDRQMEQTEFIKIHKELKSSVEKLFNPKLYQFEVRGILYKATGILGTPISKGKIIKYFTENPRDSFGEGWKYIDEYDDFLRNLRTTRSKNDNDRIEHKINQIISTYFTKNPQSVVKNVDWLADVKPQIEKLYR